jgi:uncharacterized membrane protein
VERSGYGSFKVLSQHLSGGTQEDHRNILVSIAPILFKTEIQSRTTYQPISIFHFCFTCIFSRSSHIHICPVSLLLVIFIAETTTSFDHQKHS